MKRSIFIVLFVLAITGAAWAGTLSEVTSLGALNPNDSVLWSQFGPTDTLLNTPENWTSVLGATGQVGIVGSTIGTQNFERRDEGSGWGGDFTSGDALLWNEGAGGQTGIDFGFVFNSPVFGAGLQLQPDYLGDFTATVTAFDAGFNVIGQFSADSTSTQNEDGSALFLGILDTAPEIAFLEFNVTDATNDGDSMAVDTLFIASATATPEPASLLMIASGLLGCGLLARRRRTVR